MANRPVSTNIPVDPPSVGETQRKINLLLEEVAKLSLEKEKIQVIGGTSNNSYLIVTVVFVVVGIVGIAAIMLWRPDADFLLVSGGIFTFITLTITNLFGFMKAKDAEAEAREARFQARETHLAVNSRLDEFIRNAEEAARAQGMQAGGKAANERTDALAHAAQPTPIPATETSGILQPTIEVVTQPKIEVVMKEDK